MKKILFFIPLLLLSCAELNQMAGQMPTNVPLSQQDIGNGLKEALTKGINTQVQSLAQTNGFFNNDAVRILLPEELRVVDTRLRQMGMSSLADDGLRILNRAAEEAVKEATPIFIDAVRQMTWQDARNILMGNQRAATSYLEQTTRAALYQKFNPVIQQNFRKVGADKIWENIINQYNALPLVRKVNPNLTDYTTQKALDGVFTMISVEEVNIRTNITARNTDALRRIFALQDKK
jgi:hypothetical protein